MKLSIQLSDTLPPTLHIWLSRIFNINSPTIRSDVNTFLLIKQDSSSVMFPRERPCHLIQFEENLHLLHRNSYSMFASFLHVNGFARSMFSFKSFENIFAVVWWVMKAEQCTVK